MKVRRSRYWCSDCPGAFDSAELIDDYGVLALRSQGAGTLVHVDTFEDPVFDEVMAFARRHLAGRREVHPGDLVRRLFGLTVDPDADGSAFVVGGDPTCPGCGSRTWWQVTEPPEFFEMDVPHVTHRAWEALSEGERQHQLEAGVIAAPGRGTDRALTLPATPTYVDLYFPANLHLDRDEIQGAIEADLGPVVDVVGGGLGDMGSHLDLAISWATTPGLVLRALVGTLTRLRVPDETVVAISQPPEKLSLAELRRRSSPVV